MEHWDKLTLDERQERIGDPTVDRAKDGEMVDAEFVRRLLKGEPMTAWMKKRARAAIKRAAN